MEKKNKVVLAYSGGLDTSVIIPWLKENYSFEVIAVCINVGQQENLEQIKAKAYQSGASKVYIEDVRKEFVENYIFPALKAGAIYEGKYLLGTSLARPLMAKKLVEIAERENAVAISHGATGKGNDQVRFELGFKALNPAIKIIAPWRIWEIKSREDAIEYARERGIPVPVTKKEPYSVDWNIWHVSHEGGDLEDPWLQPEKNVLSITVNPEKAPDKPLFVEIYFEKGVPKALNGEEMEALDLLESLNRIGGINGIGITDMIENRLIGLKSRGIYECPGGTILYSAHKELERLTLDRETMSFKELVAAKYAELVYDGLWFSPLKKALDSFVNSTQKNVTGTVRLKLYKGNCTVCGIKFPYSLYNQEYVTFGEDQVFDQKDAEGFINLFGLALKIQALMKQKNEIDKEGTKVIGG